MQVMARWGASGEWHATVRLDNGLAKVYTIRDCYNRPTDAEFLALATAENEYYKIMETGGIRQKEQRR